MPSHANGVGSVWLVVKGAVPLSVKLAEGSTLVTPVSSVVVSAVRLVSFMPIWKSPNVYGLVKAEILNPTVSIAEPFTIPRAVSSLAV